MAPAPDPRGRRGDGPPAAESIGVWAVGLKVFSRIVRGISLIVTGRRGRASNPPAGDQPPILGTVPIHAAESFSPFLGDDLVVYLVLAMGAALVAGNVAAVLRPPRTARAEGELEKAPVTRSLVMAGIGLIAAIWALLSLLTA